MNELSQKKMQQQTSSQQEFQMSGGHSQSNLPVSQMGSATHDTAQNINLYQKQIKSNNQVFKQNMSLHNHIQTSLQQKQQQAQEGSRVYIQQVSPNIDKFRKTVNQGGNNNQIQSKGSIKDFKYGTQFTSNSKHRNKIGTQPGGQKQLQSNQINHRRSKTDGNIPIMDPESQAAANEAAAANANPPAINQSRQQQYQDIQQMIINETKFMNEGLQDNLMQNSFMSRQQAINSNQNLFPKTSNQSAKSAQIQISQAQKLLLNKHQKNDPNSNNAGGNRNLSVEQAAKNLKLIGGSDDIMQAPTRNSNLISHPNKDKMAKNQANRGDPSGHLNIQNKKDLIHAQLANQQQFLQESKQFEINNKQESSTSQAHESQNNPHDDSKSGGQNISMDQLKQLMKNPQIAQFLKEQIEIQQQQQQSFQTSQDTFGVVKSSQRIDLQDINELKKDSLDHNQNAYSAQKPSNNNQFGATGDNQSSNQKIPVGIGNTESNMNSDTSQEIIKYQQEWAKQFHEQVNGMTNIERQELNAMMTANSNNTQGQRSSAMDRDQSSSQFITGTGHGNSHEQIMLLPESAYTHNMQKLNEKKTEFKTGPISSMNHKERHLLSHNIESISEARAQAQNIDFYNQIQNQPSESQVESQSPISLAYQNLEQRKFEKKLQIVDTQNDGTNYTGENYTSDHMTNQQEVAAYDVQQVREEAQV